MVVYKFQCMHHSWGSSDFHFDMSSCNMEDSVMDEARYKVNSPIWVEINRFEWQTKATVWTCPYEYSIIVVSLCLTIAVFSRTHRRMECWNDIMNKEINLLTLLYVIMPWYWNIWSALKFQFSFSQSLFIIRSLTVFITKSGIFLKFKCNQKSI